jgi:hypothetical protein
MIPLSPRQSRGNIAAPGIGARPLGTDFRPGLHADKPKAHFISVEIRCSHRLGFTHDFAENLIALSQG